MLNLRILFRNLLENIQEQTIRHFQDIRLVDTGHLLSPMILRILKSVTNNSCARFSGDDLLCVNGIFIDLLLHTDIEILGVLPENHHIHI